VLAVMATPGQGETLAANWCAPTAKVDCGHVLASRYARIGPIGAAQLGFAYFAFLAAWFGAVGVPNRPGRAWHLLPLGVIGVGLLFSAWFVYLMAVRLPVWCPWCVATHVVNALLFIATLAAWPRAARAVQSVGAGTAQPPSANYPSLNRAVAVLAGSVGVMLIAGLGLFAMDRQTRFYVAKAELMQYVNNADYIEWRWRSSPVVEIPIREDDVTLGRPDAKLTLVVFSDFECPACASLHRMVGQLVIGFPKTVRVVFKHFPLNPKCNPQSRMVHQYACEAAEAAEAARAADPGRATAYRDALYASREELVQRPYADLAKRVGIDVGVFEKRLAEGAGRARIAEDVELGRRIGVTGSGQIFLDGRKMPIWQIVQPDGETRDGKATLALWERLLGEKVTLPTTRPTSAPESR